MKKIIVNLMNVEQENNWTSVAMEVWPDYSVNDIHLKFHKGKMAKVLEEWGLIGGKTSDLFAILQKLNRMDVFFALHEIYPSIR